MLYVLLKRVKLVYYSGTGCTERVARCFEGSIRDLGSEVHVQSLSKNAMLVTAEYDMLVLLFAVHACNAPEVVYKWLDGLEHVKDKPAVVISVSGGGEVMPNTACRVTSINKLESKGYQVFYEQMLVMPSNWIVSTKPPLAKMLLNVLPQKIKIIVNDIEKGVFHRTTPYMIDRFFTRIGLIERLGARYFGKHIRFSDSCTGCGWCSSNCPAGNITLEDGRPKFSNKCHLCLKCIYGCPRKALKPGLIKFVIIKDGFDLNSIDKIELVEEVDVLHLTKGYLWSGVRKYLLD